MYEVDKSSSGAVTRTVTYYPAGGAVRINSTVYYVLKDHLGSAYATTDASGNILDEMRYYAFDETRFASGTMLTDRLYTSQRYMTGIGLYHYNARFYSATLGRFISADTITTNPFSSQGLNRYSYVFNNPIRFTDPSGHACDWYDCTLSLASVIFSVGTFPGMPAEIQIPAYILDIVATGLAYESTEYAYSQGEITNVYRTALNATGILDVLPSPAGLGLSILNMVFTFSGYPS